MAKQSTSNREPPAGIQSGLAFKESLGDVEDKLSTPIDEESAKQKPHGEKPFGNGFKIK